MTIRELKLKRLALYEAVLSNELYTGDKDNSSKTIIGVYVLPQDLTLGGHGVDEYTESGIKTSSLNIYKSITETIGNTKYIYYELREYMKLLSEAIPHVIESLFAWPQSGVELQGSFEILREARKSFITQKCKYTFGYGGLSVLTKHEQEEKNLYDFITYFPSSSHVPMTLANHIKRCGKEALVPEYVHLEETDIPNMYRLFYSMRNHFSRHRSINTEADKKGGIELLKTYKLRESKLSDDEKINGFIHHHGWVIFDVGSYKAWKKSIPVEYSNQDYALAYMRIKAAMQMAMVGTLAFPIKEVDVYGNILKRGNIISKEILNMWETNINTYYRVSKLPEDVSSTTLNKIELSVRQRFYLLNAIETTDAKLD